MATNIPPHNLKEVCNACRPAGQPRASAREDPQVDSRPRLSDRRRDPEHRRGDPADLRDRAGDDQAPGHLRAHPDRPSAVLITSIPYGIEKDALVERIGELIAKGQVPQLTNVKDLSTDDVRILLELRSGANPDAALAYLFKNSPLQINYSINLTCLLPADGAEVAVPARLDLKSDPPAIPRLPAGSRHAPAAIRAARTCSSGSTSSKASRSSSRTSTRRSRSSAPATARPTRPPS